MDKERAEKIFSTFELHNFYPKIELIFSNNFTLLVAVMLSAQATDKKVNEVTPSLFPKYDTPAKMWSLGTEKLKEKIKTIGLYNSKAKNIIATSKMLVDKYNSIVPNTLEDLTLLPGVGRKSANVILNAVFNHPAMAVDTHVFRLAHRLGISKSKNLLHVEKDLIKFIPSRFLVKANQWLVLHGRYVCKARNPDCKNCTISKYCPSVIYR